MATEAVLTHPTERAVRRRTRRDPRPRFKASRAAQLDAVLGCPALAVPDGHLARQALAVVGLLDLSRVEARYSSLGRHGYQPRSVLAVWIYASLVGLHESTKVAAALKTDSAFRLLSGGHEISEGTLRRFRRENRDLFEQALIQTVRIAAERELLKVDELAVDSWRLRADASLAEVGTLERSKARLAELTEAAPPTAPEMAERRRRSLEKHRAIVAECERLGRTNVVRTSPAAGLLKFPYGASAPGHRVTVTAAGAKERIVVAVFLDAAATDHGHLAQALDGALGALASAEALRDGAKPRAAADAGYWSEPDVVYAANNAEKIEVHVADQNAHRRSPYFGRERFTILGDLATCPAGRPMQGPMRDGANHRFLGVDCGSCDLRPQCTSGRQRALVINPEFERAKADMKARTTAPNAQDFYRKRLAIIESVFSNIEDTMGYRRATARVERSVIAEVLLKLLAHNISRLIAGGVAQAVLVVLEVADEF